MNTPAVMKFFFLPFRQLHFWNMFQNSLVVLCRKWQPDDTKNHKLRCLWWLQRRLVLNFEVCEKKFKFFFSRWDFLGSNFCFKLLKQCFLALFEKINSNFTGRKISQGWISIINSESHLRDQTSSPVLVLGEKVKFLKSMASFSNAVLFRPVFYFDPVVDGL